MYDCTRPIMQYMYIVQNIYAHSIQLFILLLMCHIFNVDVHVFHRIMRIVRISTRPFYTANETGLAPNSQEDLISFYLLSHTICVSEERDYVCSIKIEKRNFSILDQCWKSNSGLPRLSGNHSRLLALRSIIYTTL